MYYIGNIKHRRMQLGDKEQHLTLENSIAKDNEANKAGTKSKDTFFKTLSRNHYDLLKMVDNKAAIILTVNSILISFLGALHLAPDGKKEIIGIFFSILIYFCIASMIFALFGMMPHKYYGKKFKQSGYNGNLYAGNFADRSLDEFQSAYKTITENKTSVFNELTKDLYFLGCAIKHKQNMIKGSVITLLLGLFSAGIYTYFQI